MTTAESSCFVCTEPLTPTSFATCDVCGHEYHLNQRSDMDGKDCGLVWINEEHLGLEFSCNTCLEPPPVSDSLNDVMDLDEAAVAVGARADDLRAAADAGQLRHRKTGGGVYLFERGDLLAFAKGGTG